jgi:redox-sensitive bicupin YhaK (pirin superfamily)
MKTLCTQAAGFRRIPIDMEIITYILEGALEHRDSMGTGFVNHQLALNRHAWIQVARGAVMLNGENLDQGDGAAISGEPALAIEGRESAEILLFDLA